MRQLFPVWTDAVVRSGLVLAAAALAGAPLLLMGWVRSPLYTEVGKSLEQPVQFDHRHHVRDDGIDCLYCHYDAERSPNAGMPETATCMGCHGQIWKDSPMLEPIRASWARGEPLVWQRVHDLPDFVYFDHSIHLKKGVGCETCHGRVDLMPLVYKAETLQMGWCLDCHRNPEPHLRPREKVTEMGYEPVGDPLEMGRKLAKEYDVKPPTHCSACHR